MHHDVLIDEVRTRMSQLLTISRMKLHGAALAGLLELAIGTGQRLEFEMRIRAVSKSHASRSIDDR